MKNPKKLTRLQKMKLSKKHLDPEDYLMVREYADKYIVQKKDKIGTDEDMIEIFK